MLAFELKAACFRARRVALDARGAACRWPLAAGVSGTLLAEVTTPLRHGDLSAPGEARLVAGKIENLRVALRRIDGAVVPPGGTFSFWRQIGRATRRSGYVEGRELREGCIIPTVGGGLCQLSNALYAAALEAECEIIERHAHSQVVPGSEAARDRDATVFWNYVDLRFRAEHELTIRCHLEANHLVVRFLGAPTTLARAVLPSKPVPAAAPGARQQPSCFGCTQESCARHRREDDAASGHRTAFLLDAYWPEHDAFVTSQATPSDLACIPLDGRRFNLPQYAWTLAAVGELRQAPVETLARAVRSRRLAEQGAARQRSLLHDAEQLARRFARRLSPDVDHVVVMQHLLPYLWCGGYLGGRTFDVLMTALPMQTLHEVLDGAARLHPQSTTLADFRAPHDLVEAEREALARARLIVTPHREIARGFGARAFVLPWSVPDAVPHVPGDCEAVLFPGSTLGRSGAHEMREAARRLGAKLILVGNRDAEGPGFWNGIEIARVADFAQGLRLARVVCLPAFVEHRPRRLLQAMSMGVPVVASSACGLAPAQNLTIVSAGDVDELTAALSSMLF
jgi:hypothetical protein